MCNDKAMKACWPRVVGLLLLGASAWQLRAGGSGLNVVVVVNQNSTNSVQLGNYYCEKRQVPPQNLLRVNWSGGNVQWSLSDFNSVVANPLQAMVAARQLTNQVDYVLLSMDLPYRISESTGANSTTSPLLYGFVPDGAAPGPGVPASCSLPNASSNAYAGSEALFRSLGAGLSKTNFLGFMLTASNLAQGKLIVDRALASDSAFFTQTVYLVNSGAYPRNLRYIFFDNTVFDTRLRGNYSVQRTNVYQSSDLPYMGGYENGIQLGAPTTNFAPGALADQLTSYGGQLFEQSDHTTSLQFVSAGADASYGTVVEPCLYFEKFPSPQVFFYQARGFSAGESYYQSVTNPYQGLLLGEPLSAPFALPAAGSWTGLPSNSLLRGTTNLALQFQAPDTNHPVQQVDLFMDGSFLATLTNIAPRANNILWATLNGRAMSYTVPANATVQTVAAGLTTVLNSGYTGHPSTRIIPTQHGDRIELQCDDITKAGSQISAVVSNSAGSASALTSFLAASRTNFLDTVAYGIRAYTVENAPASNSYFLVTITKTNNSSVTVGATNSGGTSISALAQLLFNNINAAPALQGADGIVAEDFVNLDYYSPPTAQFNLLARSPGWNAAQVQVNLSGPGFGIQPAGTYHLDENLPDLEPRNHLYVTVGATNLQFSFPFNTTAQADGWHELSAVAYEGSHVRTQKRVTQTVRIQNTTLSATFTTLYGDSNTAVSATLQFTVLANTNNIGRIELFSTGGSLGSVLNLSNATFSVAGTSLGVGLHPFYAVVTANSGSQYRTETKWIRLLGPEPPFQVSLASYPTVLRWPATAGRSYDILSTTNITNTFQLNSTLTPSNSAAQWNDPNPAPPRRFYRVRTSS
jgi:uncharacterized protein (TIGR03790 family)